MRTLARVLPADHRALRLSGKPCGAYWDAVVALRGSGHLVLLDQHNVDNPLQASGDGNGSMAKDRRIYLLTPHGVELLRRVHGVQA